MKDSLLKIFILGFLLRLIISPFLFHPDIKSQYFHAQFLGQGVVNIYNFISIHKPELPYKDTFNYPPYPYFFMGSWLIVVKMILGNSILNWLNYWGEGWFGGVGLFGFLLLLKLPLLAADLITGILIYKLAQQGLKTKALIIWLFNPLTLYIVYGLSNFDVIPTMLSLASIFFLKRNKFLLAGIFLGVATGFKFYPLLFVPLIGLYLLRSHSYRGLINFLIGLGMALLPLTLFIPELRGLSQNGLTNRIISLKLPVLQLPTFYLIYLIFLIVTWLKGKDIDAIFKVIFFCLLTVLIITNFNPQWLLWLTPFLVLMISQQDWLLIPGLSLFVGLLVHVLNFNDRFLLLGIFGPLIPTVYDSANLEKTIYTAISPTRLYQIRTSLFLLTDVFLLVSLFKTKIQRIFSQRVLLFTFLGVSLSFFLILLGLAVIYDSRKILAYSQGSDLQTRAIIQNKPLTNSFRLQQPINRILVELKNPNIRNKDPFKFKIGSEDQSFKQEFLLSGANIGDDDWVQFQFNPAPINQRLDINLSSATTNPSQAIMAYLDDQDRVALKAYYQESPTIRSKQLISTFFLRLKGDREFLILWLTVIVLVGLPLFNKKISSKMIELTN